MLDRKIEKQALHLNEQLTMRNFIRIKIFVHIHSKIHHVGITKEIQFSLEQLFFIVYLKQQLLTDSSE